MNKSEVSVCFDVALTDKNCRQTIRYIGDFRPERERSVIFSVPDFYLPKKSVFRSHDETV